jgi:hypothetical protein
LIRPPSRGFPFLLGYYGHTFPMDEVTLSQLLGSLSCVTTSGSNQLGLPSTLDAAKIPQPSVSATAAEGVAPSGEDRDSHGELGLIEDSDAAAFLEFCAIFASGQFRRGLLDNYDTSVAVLLGGGGFSDVFLLEMDKEGVNDGETHTQAQTSMPRFVACRQWRFTSTTKTPRSQHTWPWADFAIELRAMGVPEVLDHPNILKLLSVEFVESPYGQHGIWQLSPLCFIYEYAELGSLGGFLNRYSSTNIELPLATRIQLCLDIGKGILVLHRQFFVHTDLK